MQASSPNRTSTIKLSEIFTFCVPQGSLLGPKLCNVHVRVIASFIIKTMLVYDQANDTSICEGEGRGMG